MRMFVISMALAALSTGVACAADAKAGQGVYDKSCKSCHGGDGTPNPAIGRMMKVGWFGEPPALEKTGEP